MEFKPNKYIEPNFEEDKLKEAPDCAMKQVEKDGCAPKGYHATSIFPEYFKVNGQWLLAKQSRMDAVPVYEDNEIKVVEFRNLKKGDNVIVGRSEDGSEGIFVHNNCFVDDNQDNNIFAFKTSHTRETSFSCDYEELSSLLKYEKEHNGYVVWVLGPACSFDTNARKIMSKLIKDGYCQALLAGNALATHDLEGAYLGTALGCDIKTRKLAPLGHYNHLDTINAVKTSGSIKQFIEDNNINDGIIYTCVKNNVPFVLTSSIRDDGPLPEVIGNCYDGQNEMRKHISKATTIICMASMLHSIASGNMTPVYRIKDDVIRPLYFYMIDASEFVANKLADRGSLSARSIITNVQDFLSNLDRKINE